MKMERFDQGSIPTRNVETYKDTLAKFDLSSKSRRAVRKALSFEPSPSPSPTSRVKLPSLGELPSAKPQQTRKSRPRSASCSVLMSSLDKRISRILKDDADDLTSSSSSMPLLGIEENPVRRRNRCEKLSQKEQVQLALARMSPTTCRNIDDDDFTGFLDKAIN